MPKTSFNKFSVTQFEYFVSSLSVAQSVKAPGYFCNVGSLNFPTLLLKMVDATIVHHKSGLAPGLF